VRKPSSGFWAGSVRGDAASRKPRFQGQAFETKEEEL
jgi:hypothetical protein